MKLKRLFRFSLLTLLVLVTITSGVIGWQVRELHRQRKVVAWIEEMGGLVWYESELDGMKDARSVLRLDKNGKPVFGAATPAGPKWLRRIVGEDFFESVVCVRLEGIEVTNASPLAALKTLEGVNLFSTSVADISPLADLKELTSLTLSDSPVTDISPLADLNELKLLALRDTPVSDITPLANLTRMKTLFLNQTMVTDISPLVNLTQLERLSLTGTEVTYVSPLKNLRQLQLGWIRAQQHVLEGW